MGSQNSTLPSSPSFLRSKSAYEMVTPKMSLMRLKKGKSSETCSNPVHRPTRSVCPPLAIIQASTELRAILHGKTVLELDPTAVCSKPQAAFAQIRAVVSDIQCEEMDCEEDETVRDAERTERPQTCGLDDSQELVTAPFAVVMGKEMQKDQDESSERKTDIGDDRSSRATPHRKPTFSLVGTPVNVRRRFNVDVNSEPYKKRVGEAKRTLMEALFEGKRCNGCQRPIGEDAIKASCGHAFHSECVEDKPKCPKCGETMEKGFVV
ncbi:MAG: hypothetical protein P4M11_13400 [Candidatus Pacebacteria bacterium]|nr:hypothetical protein [Candidatus Paceibacterota bacterium]